MSFSFYLVLQRRIPFSNVKIFIHLKSFKAVTFSCTDLKLTWTATSVNLDVHTESLSADTITEIRT